jgi:hypothetical protein
MPDIEALDGVAAGSIEAVNGVAKADIESINGTGFAASGATQWGVGLENGALGYAASQDLTSWTTYYIGASNESVDFVDMAYGTNGSGVNRWVIVWTKGSGEVKTTNDITSGSGGIGGANLDIKLRTVGYCNDTWVTMGQMKSGAQKMYTSLDGSTWTSRDLSGLSGIGTTDVYGIAHDGSGDHVVFTQDDSIYFSDDKGATWAVGLAQIDPSGSTAVGRHVVYLAGQSRFVVLYHKPNQGLKMVTAAASDLTTWSAPHDADDNLGNSLGSSAILRAVAAAGSTFVACYGASHQRFTLSGSTITNGSYSNNSLPHGNVRDLGTDGTTWLAVHDDGDISVSTNDGATFSSQATGVQVANGVDDIECVAANVILPV